MAVAITLSWETFSTQGEFNEIEIHRNPESFTPDGSTLLAIVEGDIKTYTDDTVEDDSYYALVGVEKDDTRRPMRSFLVPLCGKPEPEPEPDPAEPEPEPEPVFNLTVNAYMVEDDSDANAYMNSNQGQTPEEIYLSWPRVTDRTWFDDPTTADQHSISYPYVPADWSSKSDWRDTQAWIYEGPNTGFQYQFNSTDRPVFIVSNDKVTDLRGSGVLTSDYEDDDSIGILIAADKYDDGSGNDLFRFLALWVSFNTRNSVGAQAATVSLRYGDETNGATDDAGNPVPYGGMGDIIKFNAELPRGDWKKQGNATGDKVKYEFEKTAGGIVTARVSDRNGSFVNPATELTLDMNTELPRQGALLASNPARYGYAVSSQRYTYFQDVEWQSSDIVNTNVIYSAYGNKKWTYTGQGSINGWALQGGARPDFNGVGRIDNILTSESFSFDGNVFRPIVE